jgi:hypothetical protein
MNLPMCIIFTLLSLFAYGETYRLVIGSMFKNEAPYLKEWIEYHRLIGVEHFYLYDNESTDNFREVLAPYIEEGVVDLISWPCIPQNWQLSAGEKTDVWGYQYGAFDDCIQRTLGVSHWVGLFDIDEFLLPLKGPIYGIQALHHLLDDASAEIGTFAFIMTNYGTSNIEKIPEGTYITDLLLHRQRELWRFNDPAFSTKCIHRPKAVHICRQHFAILKDGFYTNNIPPEEIRINHYRTRDLTACLIKRGNIAEDVWWNQVFDDAIVPFTKILKGL